MSRLLFLIAGTVCVALGAIGVVMPLLPTTPFVLLGAVCFARSSPSLHAWLLGHRVFGPLIEDWRAHRAIAPRAKTVALATMGITLLVTIMLGASPALVGMQTLVLAAAALFILTRPTRHAGGTESVAVGIGARAGRDALLARDPVAEQGGAGQQH